MALPVGVGDKGEGLALAVALGLGVAVGDTLPSHVPRMAALSRRRVLPVKFRGERAQQKPPGLRSASGGKSVVKRSMAVEAEYRRLLLAPQWVKWRVVLGKPGRGAAPPPPQMLPLPDVAKLHLAWLAPVAYVPVATSTVQARAVNRAATPPGMQKAMEAGEETPAINPPPQCYW